MIYDINDENYEFLIHKFYQSKYYTQEELDEDLQRIIYIKKLISKYLRNGEINERLILNHIIILGNVFGPEFTCKLLIFKIDKSLWPVLKTFLIFLQYLPSTLQLSTIDGKICDLRDIPIDQIVLKKIKEV